MRPTATARQSGSRLFARFVAGSVLILRRRVIVPRCAFREERPRAERSVGRGCGHDDIGAVREGVWRDGVVDDRHRVRSGGDREGVLTSTWHAIDPARNDARADANVSALERRIRLDFARQLGRSEIVLTRFANRRHHQPSEGPKDQASAKHELCFRFHLEILYLPGAIYAPPPTTTILIPS